VGGLRHARLGAWWTAFHPGAAWRATPPPFSERQWSRAWLRPKWTSNIFESIHVVVEGRHTLPHLLPLPLLPRRHTPLRHSSPWHFRTRIYHPIPTDDTFRVALTRRCVTGGVVASWRCRRVTTPQALTSDEQTSVTVDDQVVVTSGQLPTSSDEESQCDGVCLPTPPPHLPGAPTCHWTLPTAPPPPYCAFRCLLPATCTSGTHLRLPVRLDSGIPAPLPRGQA